MLQHVRLVRRSVRITHAMLNLTVLGMRLFAKKPALVAMDPYTLSETVLVTDGSTDFVNTATFSAVDRLRSRYYTLLQPVGMSGIHLGRFALDPPTMLATLPLPTTIAFGHCGDDGALYGVDIMNSTGPYFARIDPDTATVTCQTWIGKNFTMDVSGVVAMDGVNSRTYAVMSPARGGNAFTLFTFDASCNRIAEQVLWPTPDLQGPSGLTFYRPRGSPATDAGTLLAFLPPIGGAWELVAIDPRSGSVTATNAARGLPALHLFDSGAIFLAPRPSGNGSVLHVALASEPGLPSRIFGIDVACALEPSVGPPPNCTLSNRAWPRPPHRVAPVNLALYSPPTSIFNLT